MSRAVPPCFATKSLNKFRLFHFKESTKVHTCQHLCNVLSFSANFNLFPAVLSVVEMKSPSALRLLREIIKNLVPCGALFAIPCCPQGGQNLWYTKILIEQWHILAKCPNFIPQIIISFRLASVSHTLGSPRASAIKPSSHKWKYGLPEQKKGRPGRWMAATRSRRAQHW